MQTLKITQIVADKNQPRKYFAADKMHSLKESIKENGIINPLIVEKTKDGKYILVDGERRFRAAGDLKLGEVPAIVIKSNTPAQRLVKQFNIQEQYSQWTPLEKAVALTKLSESLNQTITQVCNSLNMSKSEKDSYVAFAELADKKNFIESEIPLDFAAQMRSVRNFTKTIVENVLEEEFVRSDEKHLEAAMIRTVKNGSVTQKRDLIKLKDAFKKNPKLIKKFIDDAKATPQGLFVEAKAKGAYYLRNLLFASTHIANSGRRYMEAGDVKVSVGELQLLRTAYDVLKKVIEVVE